jgi:hypothetical protein
MKPKLSTILVLIFFTSLMFSCVTPKNQAEHEFTESPQETTKPILTSLESYPLQNGTIVHMFQKSPREQIRATVGEVEGKTYMDLRVFNRVAQFNYVPTDMGLTIPAELLPELELAIEKLHQSMTQNK